MTYTIEKNLTTVNKGSAGSNDPEWIIVHFVGASGQAWANSRYFKSIYRGASAQYFVDPTTILQVVEDNRSAWHIGDGHRTRKGAKNGYVHKGGATNTNSIGIEGCQDTSTGKDVWSWEFHPETVKRIEWLVRLLQKKYNIDDAHVIRHFDATGKLCPGNWSQNNWAEWKSFKNNLSKDIVQKVSNPVKRNEGKHDDEEMHLIETGETLYGIAKDHGVTVEELVKWNDLEDNLIFPETKIFVKAPEVKIPAKPTTIQKLVEEVLAGKHGNGEAREKSLGKNYKAVQAALNKTMLVKKTVKPKPAVKSVDQLVKEVMAGKHGSGDARKKSLGSRYNEVQAKINGTSVKKAPVKSIKQLADEVMAGKHGSGQTRMKSLGANYAKVQAEVNRRVRR